MRRTLPTLLVLATAPGCHLLNGLEDLNLREGAKHIWSASYGDELVQTIDDVAFSQDTLRVAGATDGELDLGDEPLDAPEPARFLAQLDGQGMHHWSLLLDPAIVHHGLVTGTTRVVISHQEPVDVAGLSLAVAADTAFEVVDVDDDGAGATLVIAGAATDLVDVQVVQQPDEAGHLLVGATFEGTLGLGECDAVEGDDQDIAIARVERRECVWLKRFGGGQRQWIDAVAADATGNVIVAGRFQDRIDFGDETHLALGGTDYFLVKLDEAGEPLWSRRYGDLDRDQRPMRLAVRPSGTISIAGYYLGDVDFGLGAEQSSLGHDIFVAKLDPSGNTVWSRHFSVRNDAPADMPENELTQLSLVVDRPGNTILAGHFRGSLDFGGNVRTSDGDLDVFLFKLDVDGLLQWSDNFGDGEDQCDYVDCVTALAVDAGDNIILGGGFAGSMNVGGDDLDSAGDSDAFLAKFEP